MTDSALRQPGPRTQHPAAHARAVPKPVTAVNASVAGPAGRQDNIAGPRFVYRQVPPDWMRPGTRSSANTVRDSIQRAAIRKAGEPGPGGSAGCPHNPGMGVEP
jgi:hypothetical protein